MQNYSPTTRPRPPNGLTLAFAKELAGTASLGQTRSAQDGSRPRWGPSRRPRTVEAAIAVKLATMDNLLMGKYLDDGGEIPGRR